MHPNDPNIKKHIPVLLKEVITILNPQPNQNFIDCTVGEGGHSTAILEKTAPQGKLLGIDLNTESLEVAALNVKTNERFILVQGNFKDIEAIAAHHGFKKVVGIVMDLGLSTRLLETSGKGFTFLKDEPLDMRFGNEGETACTIVNLWPKDTLETIIKEWGEERYAKSIASAIVRQRQQKPILTTDELQKTIQRAVPISYSQRRIHPATLTFQALRIAVNHELENLEQGLKGALEVLAPHGRLAVVSYHSLEDRMVKRFFKTHRDILTPITKKPIRPNEEEIKINPRSRSAKLRIAEKF